jgi:integrase
VKEKRFRQERYLRQIKNKNGWSFQVRYGNYVKTFSEKTYGDNRLAFKKAVEYRNEVMNNTQTYLLPLKKTIYDIMEESFDLLVVRKKTRDNHKSLFNSFIKDKITLVNFDENFIYQKLNDMVDSQTDETISRVYNVFKRIDKTCLIKKYYSTSVLSSVIPPKSHIETKNELKEPITYEDLSKIKSACKDSQLPLILDFIYLTGCRPCEVWCLTWNDISDKYISINKEVGSDSSSLGVVRTTKTPLSNRNIPLTIKLKNVLEQAKTGSELVFPDSNGKMHTTDLVGKQIKSVADKLKIDFNLYDLRHRFATDLTLNNVDDRTKMELMGHKSIKMTLDYARSNDEKKIDALENRGKK